MIVIVLSKPSVIALSECSDYLTFIFTRECNETSIAGGQKALAHSGHSMACKILHIW